MDAIEYALVLIGAIFASLSMSYGLYHLKEPRAIWFWEVFLPMFG